MLKNPFSFLMSSGMEKYLLTRAGPNSEVVESLNNFGSKDFHTSVLCQFL